jgi:hypothetical protein
MSIIHCDSCNNIRDSDFVEYETIDGNDVCIFCLEDSSNDPDGRYLQCEYCEKWFDRNKSDDCPSISCKIDRGSSFSEDGRGDE